MAKEEFGENNPESIEMKRKESEAHHNFLVLEKLLEGIEGDPETVVDLNKKYDHETMGFYWEKKENPKTQFEKLSALVNFFDMNKDSIRLLTGYEQRVLDRLLLQSKIYLAAYK